MSPYTILVWGLVPLAVNLLSFLWYRWVHAPGGLIGPIDPNAEHSFRTDVAHTIAMFIVLVVSAFSWAAYSLIVLFWVVTR